jgi:protein-S-isoprenylcysteine O-methyltransferase Ste14
MTQRKRTILLAAGCGAAAGAVGALFRSHASNTLPFFALDNTPLAKPQIVLACIPWVLFSIYWEIASKGAAKATSSESPLSRGVHVFLSNLALLIQVLPFRGFGRFLPLSFGIMALGFAVEVLGLSLAIWARRHLGRNWSGEISIKVEHQLIRSGPYRRLRHPIYTALLTMYVGTALVSGRWLALVGLVLAVFAYWRKIRLEEANLNAAFGADFDAYRRESWALVPGLF